MHAIEGNGYHLDIACMEHDGTICHVDEKQAVASIRDASRLVWMNIVVKDDEAVRRLLQDEMKFHELAVEDSLSDNERPTLQEFGDHLFVAASKVIEHPGQPEEYVEVGMFLTKSALVTVVRQPLPFLHEWFVRYEKKKHVFGEAAAFLMHSIIDNIVDEYFVAIDALEDEVDALDLLAIDLREHGAKVTGVSSAAEALELLKTQFFDLIISDIGMADTDGYGLIKQVRAAEGPTGPHTPAIALTAYARAQDRLRALSAGYNTHVAKPVDIRELVSVVKCLTSKIG